MKLYSILLLIFSSDVFAKDQPCATEFTVNPIRFQECKQVKPADARLACFKKIFGPRARAVKGQSGDVQYVEITTNGKLKICVNGLNFQPSGILTAISYVEKNQTLTLSGIKTPIKIGRFEITEGNHICNLTVDGKLTGDLIPEYSFLPDTAKLKIASMQCREIDNHIDGREITLAEPTTVCDLKMPAGTSFGYWPDGAYHFTAVANGSMKVTDGEVNATVLDVEKGKNYRNLNPIKAPCDWSETPPNVLDPLNEEE